MKYDVIIIGGGIIGFSVAMQLLQTTPNLKVVLLEKESTPARHQSGHNSGVIHAGVYYTPGSLKAKFCFQGCQQTKAFCEKHQIKYISSGKLIIATNELEMQRMRVLAERCQQNGLDFVVLDQEKTLRQQPQINSLGSIFVKNSGIVDWVLVTNKYFELYQYMNGKALFNEEVIKITESDTGVKIKTKQGHCYESKFLVSCAGLYADKIVQLSGLKPTFSIIPFRGEYYQLNPKYNNLFKHLIYPVPNPSLPFLGVHFTPQINGDVTVGPNAVLALAREGYSWKNINLKESVNTLINPALWRMIKNNFKGTINELKGSLSKTTYLQQVKKYFPAINKDDLLPHSAGVRAQAVAQNGQLIDDFLFMESKFMLHTCNAPSPAATSSLPIGKYIVDKVMKKYQL